MLTERTCVVCGEAFVPRTSRVITCSPACSRENRLQKERDRNPVGSRAKPRPVLACKQCGASFEAKRRDALFCSDKCIYAASAEVKRERCRNWRIRNPEKQLASTKRWQENNRERYLESNRRRVNTWRANNPGAKAAESRRYRAAHPDTVRDYAASRTAAYQIVRLLEKFGLDALSPDFQPPVSPMAKKAAEHRRSWKARHPAYKPPRHPEKQREAQRRHHRRESAALKLIREIETKGLEALL